MRKFSFFTIAAVFAFALLTACSSPTGTTGGTGGGGNNPGGGGSNPGGGGGGGNNPGGGGGGGNYNEYFYITFTLADNAPDITGPRLSRSGAQGFPKNVTLSVSDPGFANISWRVNNSSTITGTGQSFTLNAAAGGNIASLPDGLHSVTVFAAKDGRPYSNTVTFLIFN
jgi:hypothetical protein